jgi:hypothetical protein
MDNFLIEILGEDGSAALKKATTRMPILDSVVVPRAIVSWVSVVGGLGYDGNLPGHTGSYFSLIKNEKDGFDGALTIDSQLYTFENADLLHVAASVGVALGIESEPIDEQLKTKDLSKLGKSIDLLVKSQIVKQAKSQKIAPGFSLDKDGIAKYAKLNVGNKGYAEQQYPASVNLRVTWHDGMTHEDSVRGLNAGHALARAASNWPDAHRIEVLNPDYIIKKANSESHLGPGPAAPPVGSFEPKMPLSPQKQTGKATSVSQKMNLATGQGREEKGKLRVTKSESERDCAECGGKQFCGDKFTGCLCLGELSKNIATEIDGEEFVLHFKSNLDSDAIETLVEILKE